MENNKTFNSNRLKFARKRRGLTLKKLGSLVGLTSRTLSDYENNRKDTTADDRNLHSIANQLHFPTEFFFLDDISSLDETSVSFRSLARMSASVRDAAICAGQIGLEFSLWIDKNFELPETNLPDLREYEPEAAAQTIRNEWALGERPINNMIHLLEAKGVRIFSLAEDSYDMDAYSFWLNNHPFIFLNTRKSVERSRFDAAHELGHILLHKHGSPLGKEAESQANKFASAFLMPQGSVIANSPGIPTLEAIIRLKSIWKAAASAMVRRMRDLNLITEWNYRALMIELSKRGFMKNEPNAIAKRETSKLLPMIFKALREEGITKDKIARDLCLFVDDIDSLIFNLTTFGLKGGLSKNKSGTKSVKNSNHLKIVK